MFDLNGLKVGISGAIPSPLEMSEIDRSDVEIQLLVRILVERILKAGGTIVYGSHPTFTPIIEGVALGLGPGANSENRVHMFVAPFFFADNRNPHQSWGRYLHRHDVYGAVHPVTTHASVLDNPQEFQSLSEDKQSTIRQEVLDDLRQRMISEVDALVCIGGRPPRERIRAGVDHEVELARGRRVPVYLLGAFGGNSRSVYRERFAHNPKLLGNPLSNDENGLLADENEADTWAIVELVMSGLAIQAKHM